MSSNKEKTDVALEMIKDKHFYYSKVSFLTSLGQCLCLENHIQKSFQFSKL